MSHAHYCHTGPLNIPNSTITTTGGSWTGDNIIYPNVEPITPYIPPNWYPWPYPYTQTTSYPVYDNRVVYTGGTFDLFHIGHVNLLKRGRAIAGEHGKVVVSLNTDEFITKFKGKAPIYSYEQRKDILEACKYVSEVIPNTGGSDSKPAILKVRPNFIVIGSDWAAKDYYKQMGFTQKWLDDQKIVLIYVPYTEGISTSEIKNTVRGVIL